jgi:hypothetical protein
MDQTRCAAPTNPSEETNDDPGRGAGRVTVEVGA